MSQTTPASVQAVSLVNCLTNLLLHHSYYRLCPADEPLTEECFERHPVPWGSSQTSVRMKSGSESTFNATFVSTVSTTACALLSHWGCDV